MKRLKLDIVTILPNPSPDLPEEFKYRIKAMGGTQVVMVIQKMLFETNLTPNNGCLSMPFSKINKGVLRKSEREILNIKIQWKCDSSNPCISSVR
jgi:hypothetical protein